MSNPTQPPTNSPLPNVAKAGWIMGASLLLSRILGIIREIIIAHVYGQGDYTDAYNFAFAIPDLLFFLIAGGALSSAFIPVFSEYLHTNREKDAWHVFSAIACIMSLAVTGFIVFAWIFAPFLATIVAPNTDSQQILDLIVIISRILLPAQFAFFIGGLLFGTLYSRQIFAVPGLGPNIYNIGIIIGALVLSIFVPLPIILEGTNPERSILGPAWGALIGAFLGNIAVPLLVINRLGAQFKFTLDTKHPGVRKVFRLMLPVVLGLSLPGVFALLLKPLSDFYNISGLTSAFNNANQLMQAPLGVFGQSLALAAFPALSQFVAQKRMDAFSDQLIKTLKTVIYLTVPIAFILAFASHDIIKTVFQSGDFGPAATARTSPLLIAFAVGVPFWCLQPVLMRAFFALQNTLKPIILGTITTGIFLILATITIMLKIPPYGLALAGSLAAIILVLFLITFVQKEVPELSFKSLFPTFGKAILAGIPAALFLAGTFRLLPLLNLADSKIANIFVLGFFGICSAWIYYFATKALKMPETAYFTRALNRGKSTPRPENPTEEDKKD